jgi:hypothetical protein
MTDIYQNCWRFGLKVLVGPVDRDKAQETGKPANYAWRYHCILHDLGRIS